MGHRNIAIWLPPYSLAKLIILKPMILRQWREKSSHCLYFAGGQANSRLPEGHWAQVICPTEA